MKNDERADEFSRAQLGERLSAGVSLVHDLTRLPRPLIGLTNGHEGGHPFLADDFVPACISGKQPPVNAWVATHFTCPA